MRKDILGKGGGGSVYLGNARRPSFPFPLPHSPFPIPLPPFTPFSLPPSLSTVVRLWLSHCICLFICSKYCLSAVEKVRAKNDLFCIISYLWKLQNNSASYWDFVEQVSSSTLKAWKGPKRYVTWDILWIISIFWKSKLGISCVPTQFTDHLSYSILRSFKTFI